MTPPRHERTYYCPAVKSHPKFQHVPSAPWEVGDVVIIEINECCWCKGTMYRMTGDTNGIPFTLTFIIPEEDEL